MAYLPMRIMVNRRCGIVRGAEWIIGNEYDFTNVREINSCYSLHLLVCVPTFRALEHTRNAV